MKSKNGTKIGLIQLHVTDDKKANLRNAYKFLQIAKTNNCEIAILPECFNCPYGVEFFSQYAEEIPTGESCKALSEYAKTLKMFVVAGSIPERGGNKIYNTCTVWNPQGQLVAKHRKVHLFNVDLPGKIRFQESEALTAGSTFNTFDTENFKIGLGICHDTRFPEMANYYQEQGCKLVIYPGAFCDHLGPPHWKLLLQSRAIDNQFYVAGVACARNENAGYKSYGHSMFVNPFGEVEAATEYAEDIIYGFVDLDKVEEFRTTVPILKQKRTDMYEVQYNYKQK